MSIKKSTIAIESEILDNLDLIAEAQDMSRNKLLGVIMQEYVEKHIELAQAIQQKKQELEKLKAEAKG